MPDQIIPVIVGAIIGSSAILITTIVIFKKTTQEEIYQHSHAD